MGISVSCPFSDSDDLESSVESVIVKSISLGEKDLKTMARSISFNSRDSDPFIMKSLGSGRMIVEGSINFKRRQMETMVSINAPPLEKGNSMPILPISSKSNDMRYQLLKSESFQERFPQSPTLGFRDPKHEAALKLQKVYKSFRTRRKLADCAVLVELEQNWWNLLDSAELKHSSVSFFGIEKQETAISRWLRARTRAAKVGKGLSKNDKARKLALQHWLEAIDPRHRYGHNLHFYYLNWLRCQSREPFFYWLDIGEGREVNLVEKCPRSKLLQQCIKYLGPMERKAYEVVIVDGKLFYKQTGEILDTRGGPADAKWIFVLSTSKILYVGQKRKGTFQHSSFLAGGAASAAGRLVVVDGNLKAVWPHSGHYQPTKENFQDFISFLEENNVNLADVKMTPVDEDDGSVSKRKGTFCIRSHLSEEDLTSRSTTGPEMEEVDDEGSSSLETNTLEVDSGDASDLPEMGQSHGFSRPTVLVMPDAFKLFESINVGQISHCESAAESFEDQLELRKNFLDEEDHEKETIPDGSVLNRLGKKLSRTWTSGAGPRISCVRDHPSELQFRALEQVNLSPRSARCLRSDYSSESTSGCWSEGSTPTGFRRKVTNIASALSFESANLFQTMEVRAQPSPLRRGISVGAELSQS